MNDIITEIYTDGSALKNPGKAGYGYLIKYYLQEENRAPKQIIITGNQGYIVSTNNRMEMMAVINSLQKLAELIKDEKFITKRINLFTDSKLIADAINLNWIQKWTANNWFTFSNSPVKNKDLWEIIQQLIELFKQNQILLKFIWIKGHNGNTYNELVDHLAGSAAVKGPWLVDKNYIN